MKIVEGLRYSFDEDHLGFGNFRVLDGKRIMARVVNRSDALKIVRALNREDLRGFSKRAKPAVGATHRVARPKNGRRRFRSKLKLYGHHT